MSRFLCPLHHYIIHRVIDKAIFQTKIMDFAVIGVKVDDQLLRSTECSQRRGMMKGAGYYEIAPHPPWDFGDLGQRAYPACASQ